MADKLNLEIITPERRVLSEKVDEIVVPGLEGELGILPQHTPLISQLQTGILSYRQGTEKGSGAEAPSAILASAEPPKDPALGTIYLNSSDGHFYGWNGTEWRQLDN